MYCAALYFPSWQGASRINVGVLQAGTGRNVLPDVGLIKMETRGANTEINEFMVTEARRMIKASADMYNVDVTVSEAGGAPACVADMNWEPKSRRLLKLVDSMVKSLIIWI